MQQKLREAGYCLPYFLVSSPYGEWVNFHFSQWAHYMMKELTFFRSEVKVVWVFWFNLFVYGVWRSDVICCEGGNVGIYDKMSFESKKTCQNQIVEKINEYVIFVFLGLHYGSRKPNHTKKYQKITFGVLFSLPPQNALQCTTVQCNVL